MTDKKEELKKYRLLMGQVAPIVAGEASLIMNETGVNIYYAEDVDERLSVLRKEIEDMICTINNNRIVDVPEADYLANTKIQELKVVLVTFDKFFPVVEEKEDKVKKNEI